VVRLVEDVLDETRVRQGRLALRLQPCDLVSVVGQVVTEQTALNPERSINWVVETSPVPVVADAGRIEQVVTNYVSNALKFSPEDQTVEVRVRTAVGAAEVAGAPGASEAARENGAVSPAGTPGTPGDVGMARVSVHDEGVGIPPEDQPYIWERFYQAAGTDVQSGSQVGVGIGLYISKALVEAHLGQVGVESAPGQGTTFWFTLPLAPPRPPRPPRPTSSSAEEETHGPASGPLLGDHSKQAPDC
jgi:signal transduction histidine kinase